MDSQTVHRKLRFGEYEDGSPPEGPPGQHRRSSPGRARRKRNTRIAAGAMPLVLCAVALLYVYT